MENIYLEGTEDQYVTSTRGKALGRNDQKRHSDCDRKIIQWFMNCYALSGKVILLKVKPICSMMGIIIAFFDK